MTELALHEAQQQFKKQSPLITLLKFSVGPIVQESIEMIYSVANSLYLGNSDPNSLAGLAAAEPFENICPTIGWLFQVGLQSQVARLLSRNKTEAIRRLFLLSFSAAASLSAVSAGLLLGWLQPIMAFAGIEAGIIGDEAENYIRPMLYAAPAVVLYYLFTGFAFGLGLVKLYTWLSFIPMLAGVCVFSPVMIIALKMRCTGAGIAVALSFSLPCVVYIIYFAFFDKIIRPFAFWKPLKLNGKCSGRHILRETLEVIQIGASEFALSFGWILTIASGYYCLSQIAQEAGINEEVSACWGVVSRLRTISFTSAFGLNSGALAVSSFAQGEKDLKRFLAIHKANLLCCCVASSFFAIVMISLAPQLLQLFGIIGKSAVQIGSSMMRLASVGIFIAFIEWAVQTLYQALELTGRAMVLSIFNFVMYPASFFIFYAAGTGSSEVRINMVMGGWSAADAFCAVVAVIFWISGRKKMTAAFQQVAGVT